MNQEDKEKVDQACKLLSEKLTESDEYQNLMQTKEKMENNSGGNGYHKWYDLWQFYHINLLFYEK